MDTKILAPDEHLDQVVEDLTKYLSELASGIFKNCKRIHKPNRIEYITDLLVIKLKKRGFPEMEPFLSLFFLQPEIISKKIDGGTCVNINFTLSCTLSHGSLAININITDETIEGV